MKLQKLYPKGVTLRILKLKKKKKEACMNNYHKNLETLNRYADGNVFKTLIDEEREEEEVEEERPHSKFRAVIERMNRRTNKIYGN